ncbi:hypothetical protein BIFADO_01504 [Bifidobacterium adolescentis L2-32]|uniref:Uncharacterized protein n=1 Tax=Bifidobacterium adolescentis L2-32 TaxID=411481 RepID=A7A6M1_BIFAD|nr:hypothetical protein BIFADO_01504 [Bifidobacterium adolescentis L2-32]
MADSIENGYSPRSGRTCPSGGRCSRLAYAENAALLFP